MDIPGETALQCISAFRFLCEEFAFDQPHVISAGREQNVVYAKGTHFVSINTAPGAFPLVELFHPTRTIENRRIPRIRPDIGRGKNALNPYSAMDVDQFLSDYADALREREKDFLMANDQN